MTPALFEGAGGGEPVRLRVTRCSKCARITFPPQIFGCERCGAAGEALSDALVPAIGAVRSAVTVWRHRGPGIEAPFQLAQVELDAGGELRVLIEAGAEALCAGTRVSGHEVEAGDSPLPNLRFAPVQGKA